MTEHTYKREGFTAVPSSVRDLLKSLETYAGRSLRERDFQRLADEIAATDPFSIILFTEPLAQEHWRYKEYVNMRRVQIVSELEEVIHRHFWNDLNEKMAEYLKDHRDPDDAHFKQLLQGYHPEGKRLLRVAYQEMYPRSWKRKWRSRRYLEPRTTVEKRRRYDLPKPLCLWETLLSQQFYFMPKTRAFARGCASGSGSRETHSYFGLAYLELSKRMSTPTYILVYDKDNVLRFVDGKSGFILDPSSMGSNCAVDYGVISTMMKPVLKAQAMLSEDWSEIREIRLFR